ncbi:protein of unknown function [Legionella hackeliae]|uniref:Uncharacterized protein n=1 Tax=Legionella hackeliae TaxID=449 RepID=A0A0A8URG0_LEGHA|nr:protein of unknown function [Legionella hackeliae]
MVNAFITLVSYTIFDENKHTKNKFIYPNRLTIYQFKFTQKGFDK